MRHFTTSLQQRWQYQHAMALRIAGPAFPKTTARTKLDTTWSRDTAKTEIPLALCRTTAELPPLAMHLFDRSKLDEMVYPVADPENQRLINNEATVMFVLISFFRCQAAS